MITIMSLLLLLMYLMLNLVVTITNKIIISSWGYPYLLTSVHALASLATAILLQLPPLCSWYPSISATIFSGSSQTNDRSVQPPSTAPLALTLRDHMIVLGFSLLYTVNIALSNLTLGTVSLSLHQTIRATAPAITIFLSVLFLRRKLSSYSPSTRFSLVPTIGGVILATSNYHHDGTSSSVSISSPLSASTLAPSADEIAPIAIDLRNLIITFVGAVLAVIKTLATYVLQCPRIDLDSQDNPRFTLRLGISSTRLIRLVSPYALVQALLFAWSTGEFERAFQSSKSSFAEVTTTWLPVIERTPVGTAMAQLLVLNACAAAALNVISFEANRSCGALAMAVVANVKQVVCLLVDGGHGSSGGGDGDTDHASWTFGFGVSMTALGGMWYAVAQSGSWDGRWIERVKNKNGSLPELNMGNTLEEKSNRRKHRDEKGNGCI